MTPPSRKHGEKAATSAYDKRYAWTTAHEIEFLSHLGTQTYCDLRYKDDSILAARPVLLRRYLDAMWRRTIWGDIDPEIVRDTAQQFLQKEALHAR